MTPSDLLSIADHLASRAAADELPADAAHRVAIGRCYYAVFLAAHELAEKTSRTPAPRGPEAHRWVAEQFRGNDPAERTVFQALGRLRRDRNAAEYGDEIVDSAATARSARSIAARTLTALGTVARRR